MANFSLDFPSAYGEKVGAGVLRAQPEHFQVDEMLGFKPSGEGEHVFLHVRKTSENTQWVADQIAALAKVGKNDVGFAGLKDRHAVTTQWFSAYLPKGIEPDWKQLESETIELLGVARHSKKLRRGDHLGNRFSIIVDEFECHGDLKARLESIKVGGVPNYFGPQRFGRNANNLVDAQSFLVDGKRIKNRRQKGMVISAARSYLFNSVLKARIEQGNWNQLIDGDPEESPTGPLWGRGRPLSSGACLSLETEALSEHADWCDGLEHVGLSQERKPLKLSVGDLSYDFSGHQLRLSFSLPSGAFATSVLAEIADVHDASIPVL